jgi:hypothetical protein
MDTVALLTPGKSVRYWDGDKMIIASVLSRAPGTSAWWVIPAGSQQPVKIFSRKGSWEVDTRDRAA